MNYYTNLAYADERLRGTIVNTTKGPAYIRNIDVAESLANVIFLKDSKVALIPYKDIDLTPVQLGYINMENYCTYASRVPSRSWKQGLSQDNITYVGESLRGAWPILQLHNTIENIYPSFKEALVQINRRSAKSVAFSREFAVKEDQLLHYCGRVVGNTSKSPYLDKNNMYLIERLGEYVS